MSDEIIDMSQWYTASQALARLKANSGKEIDSGYLRFLARTNKVQVRVVSDRIRLYSRRDIDSYIVEDRGTKAARSQRQRSVEAKRQQEQAGNRPRKQGRSPEKKTGDKSPEDSHGEYSLAI